MIKHRLLFILFFVIGLALSPFDALAQSTWNGTMWVGGDPDNMIDAVIAANYNAGSFDAKSITVNAGVTFSAIGFFTTVNNMTNNGTVIMGIQNLDIGANLINNGTIYHCAGGTLNVTGTTSGTGFIYNMGATEPTDAGMGMFTFTGATATSVTITLSATGDGAKRIIVLKENSAVAGSAVLDGAVYTANANFGGAGSPIDGGKVVYNNTGNSVTVTGLTNMTTYHVAVFEYNETGNCTNYKTDTFLSDTYFLNTTASTTWNGTMWNNGTPNSTTDAIINGDYNTSTNGNFVCAQLTVNASRTLTIHGTGTVQVNTSTVNNLGTINDCNTTPGLSGAMTIAPNAKNTPSIPTSEASGINFSNITTSSFDISWLSGDGTKRVVVIKPTSAVDVNALTNGTAYTPNTNFSMGTAIDGTAKVVYNNTGNSVSVIGLTAGTNYHIAIFEYNESVPCGATYKLGSPASSSQMTSAGAANSTWNGTTWNNGAPGGTTDAIINGNYNTTTHGNITASTLTVNATFTLTVTATGTLDIQTLTITNNGTIDNCLQGTVNGMVTGGTYKTVVAEPTTAANTINFTTVTGTGFTINWTNGSGTKRLVVVKPNSAIATTAVVDGTAYTADTNFGGAGSVIDGTGKVVYNNNLNTVAVTGLTAGVTYHVAIFEYDENVNCGANYKTNIILSGSQTTTGVLTTWNGTTWDNGAPNGTTNAVIDGTYNTGTNGGITALSLIVNATRVLTLATAGSIVVTNALTNNGIINNCEPRTLTFGSFTGNAVNITATEPTTEATIMLFTAVSSTGFTINWVNGNGTKRVVVVKPTNAVSTTVLTDGTSYTASTNFGGGGSIVDVTGKVVYNDNVGTSVVVTGLTPNTTYYVAVFEYNESNCGGNYKTGMPLAGSRLTDGTPTTWNGVAWSNGAPTATTDATIAGAYSTTSGNIVAKNLTINAGQTLTIHAVAASVTVNANLTINGTFNNCIGGTTMVTGTTMGTIQVKAVEPTTEVPAVTIGSVLSNQFIVSFAVPGNGTKRIVVVKQGSAVDVNALTDGTNYTANASFTGGGAVVDGAAKVVYNDNGFGVTVTQLLPNTTYHVAVFEYNESVGCGANYKIGSPATASQTTAIATTTTWNGSTWDNGLPTATVDAVIAGNYSTTIGNITTDELTINAGQTLTVHAATATVQANMLTNNGIIINCVGGTFNPIPTGTVKLPVPTPTNDATNVTFSGITETSLTVNWTNGNGASRIVTIRPNDFPNGSGNLVDGVNYSASPVFGSGSAIEGGSVVYDGNLGNSVTITGLTAGTLYYVTIFEYNTNMDCGINYKQGGGANGLQATGLNLPAPVALDAKDITADSFLARWEMPNNTIAGAFEIDIALDATFTRFLTNYRGARVSDDKLSIKNLEPNTVYYYRVRAIATLRISANSNTIKVTTLPKAPKALDATNVVFGGFNANWEASVGADSYELQVASTLPDYTTIKVNGGATTTFKLSDLPTEIAFEKVAFYYYRIRAVTKDGFFSEYSNQITVKTVPEAPIATDATNIKETSLTSNWKEVKNADIYLLEIAEDKDFKTNLISKEVKELSSNVTGLKEGKTYFYRVKTKNTAGESGFSNIIEASTLPSKPTELRLVSAVGGSFNVSWTASKSELPVIYLIDVGTDANFGTLIIRQQRASSTTAMLQSANFVGGRNYFVRVKAVHTKDGNSEFSNSLQILLPPSAPRLSLVTDKTTENSLDLSWTRAETAEAYELDVATNANFTNIIASYNAKSIKELQTSVTGLNSFTAHFCRVRSVNPSGKSDNSNVIEVATLPNPVQTKAPSNLTLTQFRALWDASTQANLYLLEISKNESFTDLLVGFAPLEIFNTTERLIIFPENIKTLYYRIKVKGIVGNSTVVSRPSNGQKVRILEAPTLRTTNLTQTTFQVNWTGLEESEQYEISVSIDNFATILSAYNQLITTNTSVVVEKLEANRLHQIRVRAISPNTLSDFGRLNQLTLPPFPEEVYARRLSSVRTTRLEVGYLTSTFERVSNLRFIVERADQPNSDFRALASDLRLSSSRALVYDDVTGAQRLQASYRLKISNEAGEVIYNIPQRFITAVEDTQEENAILLYPNPAETTFQLQLKGINAKSANIFIFDAMGRLVSKWEEVKNLTNHTFDIAHLTTGKYIIEITWEKQKVELFLIKE
jgi:hypothetical protein